MCYLSYVTVGWTINLVPGLNELVATATAFGPLSKHTWSNKLLAIGVKTKVYNAYILCTLFCGY